MPQVSLYLNDETMDALRKRAALSDASLSKYVVRLIESDTASGWPEGYWDLFGSIGDTSFAAPEELSFELDAQRGCF